MLRMLTVLMALAAAIPAQAQDWPTRPMTMIVPFAAGGAVDVLARALGARTAEILGQQIIIENVAGAGGMTGANRVAKAAPDGYTFVLGSVGTHAQNQTLYKTPAYDAQKDFEPVALVSELPLLLVAKRDLPANDLQEFIAYAKANDGKLQFGSAGVGSAVHLGCVLFNAAAGIKATHIPYRGGGPAMQDLVAGRIDYTCNIITSALPNVKSNQIKAVANLAPKRTPLLPELRTSLEQGLDNFDATTWNMVLLPKGTPAPIVQKLNAALGQALDTPTTKERLLNIGLDIPPPEKRSPEYATKFVESEIRKYEGPIMAAGIVIE
ncbi:MAG TPA: tripartite tricarboxylate transporter substrate binding protein [Xanthobacteraceae bacterium]